MVPVREKLTVYLSTDFHRDHVPSFLFLIQIFIDTGLATL
jgi:hypothetical protein